MNESKRQQKFSKLIQKDLSDIIQKDKPGIFANTLVTVTDVQISPDLSVAKIFLSMMLVKDKDVLMGKIEKHKSEIRRDLGNKIGKQVRKIPELVFYKDEVEERASKIDKLIDELNIPSNDEDDKKD